MVNRQNFKENREDRGNVKKQCKKTWIQMLGIVVLSIFCGMLLLLITGLIPRSMIEDSCRESSVYFQEHELFPYLVEGQFNTRQDNYADCILVNILYHIDGKDLPASLIKASYYNPEVESVEVSLTESMQAEQIPNVDYFRYWHGGMVLLRPLFIFTGIQGARAALGVLLLILTGLTVFLLWRQKAKGLAVCYVLGNLIVQAWMCAFCIEYITTFLLMNVVLIALLVCFPKRKDTESLYRHVYGMLCAAGVWTCFFDFLTTETLTVTMPILFLLVLRYQKGELDDLRQECKRGMGCLLGWGISYAVTFVTKWLLAVMVLGRQAFMQAMESAGERIGGTVYLGNTTADPEASGVQRFFGAIFRNQGSLFPFRDSMGTGAAALSFFGVLFLCFAIVYLFRGKNFDGRAVALCLLVGAVPYLRYAVLENHAYLHYFFTYRAQLVTVTMLLFVTYEFGLKNLRKNS